MFKLNGVVKVIKDEEVISEKFKKREFVVTDTANMYPQDILFQLIQDRTGLIDGFNVNDPVEVSFNLRGREWTSPSGEVKYFNTLEAWRIDKAGVPGGNIPQGGPSEMNMSSSSSTVESATTETDNEDGGDLPF